MYPPTCATHGATYASRLSTDATAYATINRLRYIPIPVTLTHLASVWPRRKRKKRCQEPFRREETVSGTFSEEQALACPARGGQPARNGASAGWGAPGSLCAPDGPPTNFPALGPRVRSRPGAWATVMTRILPSSRIWRRVRQPTQRTARRRARPAMPPWGDRSSAAYRCHRE